MGSHSPNAAFFQTINYASFHEDGESERRALALQSQDRVLCVTGSGARPLDLLLDGPSEIVAIDWNPAQSHLLELKIAILRSLSYGEGLAFLGIRPSNNRESAYMVVRQALSADTREFWDRRRASIRRGVFFEGRWERFLRRASRAICWTRRELVETLLAADRLEEQHEIWLEQWDNKWWRTFLRLATHRFVVKTLLNEPGLKYIPADVSIGDYLSSRFEQASENFLFRDSPWIWALAKGRIDDSAPLPEHLKQENFDRLRERLDGITVVTASLHDYLRENTTPFDAFSLSDFSSYADHRSYDEIWSAALSRASNAARFCERRFLVRYPLPRAAQDVLKIDESLGRLLDLQDLSVVYTFLVARATT